MKCLSIFIMYIGNVMPKLVALLFFSIIHESYNPECFNFKVICVLLLINCYS